MSSKKTEHFGLSQWELTDGVVMEDFNGDNAILDRELKRLTDWAGNCQVCYGTYTGDGSNGRSLTFDHTPVALLVASKWDGMLFIRGGSGLRLRDSTSGSIATAQWSGSTLSWFNDQASLAMNQADWQYYYVALLAREM